MINICFLDPGIPLKAAIRQPGSSVTGRGGSDGCAVPMNVERLNSLGVIQVECGAQFSLALTRDGEVRVYI